ncbi:MAG: thioredoxin family protein [Polyangiaceae bacterium]|nr:thioredoxin family protein [Polyangiaceae bacterium]
MPRRTLTFVALALAACDAKGTSTAAPAPAATASARAPGRGAPRFEHAPPGADFAAVVRARRDAAEADGRRVLVYVGAPWCEPCQRFHRAVEEGKLDDQLAGLTFLELDSETDGVRLRDAGYVSKYIPLFAVPGPDGRMARSIEGSIKGDGAVAQITPRLLRLLEGLPTR